MDTFDKAYVKPAFKTENDNDIGTMTTSTGTDHLSSSTRSFKRSIKADLIFPPIQEHPHDDGKNTPSLHNSITTWDDWNLSERQDFDNVLRAAAGEGNDDETIQKLCHLLEVFEALTPGREKVGFLICCPKSLHRYGNRRFHSMVNRFMADERMHSMIGSMSDEILESEDINAEKQTKTEKRIFRDGLDGSGTELEVSASMIDDEASTLLFVARIKETP